MITPVKRSFVLGIPDSLSLIQPTSEADFDQIESHVRQQRHAWARCLRSARQDLKRALEEAAFMELRGSLRRT